MTKIDRKYLSKVVRNRPSLYSNITYKVIDELYDKTILKKIIRKYQSSIIPPFYNVVVQDENGDNLEDIEKELAKLDSKINRTLLNNIIREYFLYGTAVVYRGDAENDIFLLRCRDITPQVDSNNVLKYYQYTYKNNTVNIPPEDIAIFANDPDLDAIFGKSILNHAINTLHQFLNTQFGLTEIVDRYAIPIVLWAVDVMQDGGVISEDDLVLKFKQTLAQDLDEGDDVVIDNRVEAKLLEFSNIGQNLNEFLQEIRKDLGILTVPIPLLGGDADNLSASKIQLQVFYEETKFYQLLLNDFISNEIYIPYMEKFLNKKQGEDYKNVYINFPPISSELPSDSIIWIKTAVELGLISFDEGRAQLGYRGKAVHMTNDLEKYYDIKKGGNQQGTEKQKNADPNDDYNKTEPGKKNGKDPDTKKEGTK